MSYSLHINLSKGRTYTRTGLDWESAMALKTYFIERVPAACSGWMKPEQPTSKGKRETR